jgi:hypothetical protein
MLAIVMTRKMTTRNINTFLDRSYMAYSRAIIMTCMVFQPSQCHGGVQLTAQYDI